MGAADDLPAELKVIVEAAGPTGVIDGEKLLDLCGQRSEERGSSCNGPPVPATQGDLGSTPEQEPIGQVRNYSYHIKTMLFHVDSAILPRSCNHDTQNEHSDLLQDTSRPSQGLLAVTRRIDRKERSQGKCTEHSVGNYHLKRQTKTIQDRPILYPHTKSVSMRKLKQRPTYPINSRKGDKYHQTHVKSEKEDLKSKESDKNKSFPKRKISHLFEEIQANSYKLSEEVRDNHNQNDMIKEDTDRHSKGRKHLNNTYNGYLNICICILMYISVIVKYLVTGACQSERWRLTAIPVLTEMYTLIEIATKVDKIHKKHNKKYRKDVFNVNPDIELRNNGIYDNFIDVMKRWRLMTTPVLTENVYFGQKSFKIKQNARKTLR